MKLSNIIAAALLWSTVMITLAACVKKGPFEEAGDAIEDTFEDAGDAIEDTFEDANDAIEDAVN